MLCPNISSLSMPWLPNRYTSAMPGSSDGTRIGIIVIEWNSPLNGMQLRLSAYAKVNAMLTVITVVSDAMNRLLPIECDSAGVPKYSR